MAVRLWREPSRPAPFPDRVTSSGLIMSRLGQVSLTKPTYRRIVLRCCSVPQAKPSPDYEYGSHCGRTLWAIPLRAHGILQAGRSRPRYASGATGIGKLEHGSRPKAINEIARLRRSLPEPDPENRAAISVRSARPPIITVTRGWSAPTSGSRVDGRKVFASVDVQITNLARPFHRMLDRNPQAGRRIGMVSEDAEHGGALCAGSGSEMPDRCAVFGIRLGQRPSEPRDLAVLLRPAAILQLPDTRRA